MKHLLIPSLFSCLILVGCDGAEDRKLSYMKQAEESFEEKDYDKAKLGYKNAIQIDPKDVDARIGLAKTMVADQDWRGAAGQYTGVLEIDESHRQARLELGKLFLLARATEQAQEHADYLLEKAPDDVDALTLRAGILSQQNEVDEALQILDVVYKKEPENIDTAVLYASLLVNTQRLDKAIAVVKQTQGKVDESVDLYLILVQAYALKKENALAEQALVKITELKPEVFEHKQRLVQFYVSTDRLDDAVKMLESVIAQSERKGESEQAMDARQGLIDLHIKTGGLETAQALLDNYIESFPEAYDLKLGKARLKEGMGNKDEAKVILETIVEDDRNGPASIRARVELARILVSEQDWDTSLKTLDAVLDEKPGTLDALRLRGQIAVAQQRYDSAINDFRVVLKANPDDATIQRALAETHLKAGQIRLAENYLKQLHRRFPQDLSITMALAEVSARLGDTEGAIALREEVLLYAPKQTSNLVELAKLYVNTKDLEGLNSVAGILQNSEEGKLSGVFFEGLALQANDQHEQAIERFDEALAMNANAIEPVSAKTKSLIAMDRSEQAIEWLRELASAGDNSLASNLLGETYLLVGREDDALDAFTQAIKTTPQWLTPYRNKAIAYKALDRGGDAIETLRSALKENPGAAAIQVELAQLLEASGEIDQAIALYEDIYSSSRGSKLAANNLAMLLITYKEDEASFARAGEVAESLRGSTNPAFMDTLGWVYTKLGQLELAIPLIEEAAKRAPDAPQINYHLGYAYNKKQDYDRAFQHLEKALNTAVPFVGRANAEELMEQLNKRS